MSWQGKLAFLLLPGLAACNCGGDGVSNPTALISAEPRLVDFGRVYVGAEGKRTINLRSLGTVALQYQAQFGPEAEGFLAGPANAQVLAGGSVDIEVLFRPTRPREARTQLILEHSAANEERLLPIELRALAVAVPDCEDGNACTLDRFDLEAERCVHEAAPVACNDLDACTESDTCVEGVCLGASRSCDDNNPCTDDFCDPAQGCLHLPSSNCDDANSCTADLCMADGGCDHVALDDGTPCDDGEQCTSADICFGGRCIGVSVPDGSMCDDFDPCSKNDQCIEGICLDPTYLRPLPGELKFAVPVGPLAPGATENPILDSENSIFFGVTGGVASVDECGLPLWRNETLGTPRFAAAASTPGTLIVPVGALVHRVRARDGVLLSSVDVSPLFPPITTSSTSTVVQIVDIAVRSSGTLVVSAFRRTVGPSGPPTNEGLLIEIDAENRSSVFERLGPFHARRLGIDRDEAIIAVLADGELDAPIAEHRLARFGVTGPSSTWSTSATTAAHTELAIGFDGLALWTHGLVKVTREGVSTRLLPPRVSPARSGSPVASGAFVFMLQPSQDPNMPIGDELVCLDTNGAPVFATPLGVSAPQMSAAIDAEGHAYVVGSDGVLRFFDPEGRMLLATDLDPADVPMNASLRSGPPLERSSVAIAFSGTVVVIADGYVFGVEAVTPPAAAPWPRHRRDNLSTGHR